MNIISRAKKGFANFKNNVTLKIQTEKIVRRNRPNLKTGDALVAVITRRKVRESTMPKKIKENLKLKLFNVISDHLRSGKSWIEFREMIAEREKKEGKKYTEKEKDSLWRRWNKDQEGY